MSENILSIGCMAKLQTPIGNYQGDMWEDFSEMLNDINLYVNYEGTIVYSSSDLPLYDFEFSFIDQKIKKDFIKLCLDNGIDINTENVKVYVGHWYDGSDTVMSDTTIEEFNKG